MTIDISQTTAINTFQYLINRVNDLATAMSEQAVTVESNTAVGNASISNAFTANTLIAQSVRVSNATSNVVISVPNTQMIANGSYYLNATGNWTPLVIPVSTKNMTTSGITPFQEIDAYSMSDAGAVEYFIRIKDNLSSNFHTTKILTFHNGTLAYSTEYATMISGSSLGTFQAEANTTHVRLLYSPTSTNTAVNIAKVTF